MRRNGNGATLAYGSAMRFLQNEIVRGTRASEMMPEQVIKLFEEYGEQRRAAIFHLKVKMHFIRLLVDFQEAENALHVD